MKLLVLIVGMLYSVSAFSQYTIKGKALDHETGNPVDFGNATLFHEGKYLKAAGLNKSGEFLFENIQTGSYQLVIKISGYKDFKSEVSVSNYYDLGSVELHSNAAELGEVTVVGKKQQVIYRLDKKIISGDANIIAGGGNATDILSKIPSIRVDPDGNVSFRGSSGFVIQVNGKPSMLSAALTLQQIPASQIQDIEIMTVPSARNQAEGEAGIINIITKQQYGDGFSAAVNAYGSIYGSRGLDFTLNKQSGEHLFRVSGTYGQRYRKSDFEQEKKTTVADTSITSHSKGPRQGEFYSYILQAGWRLVKKQTDYYIDLTGGYEGRTNKGNLHYSEQVRIPGLDSVFNQYASEDYYDLHETIMAGSTGFNHKFAKKGHTLKGYFYLKYGSDALENFKSDLYDKNKNRVSGHEAWEDEHRWTVDGRIDYVLPYSSTGRMEAGYQYNSYLEDGDYTMEYWNPVTEEFDYRNDIYNTFYFQRGINTLYLMAYQKAGKFEFQAGVRGEHTHQVLRSSKEWANRTENRFELFPSAHVGYNPNESTGITAAYSRRTNRPELFFMEPYITFRDYYTAEIGNPDIRPEYINSYELAFKTTIHEQTLQLSVFHRNRTDKIERLRIPYQTGITLDSMANVGNDYSTGAEFGFYVKPYKVWNFTLNGDVYHYKVKNELDLGGRNESSVNYGLSLNNNFQLAKYTILQIDGSFVGPTVRTQGRQQGFFYADLGFRQQFLAGRLTTGLSFRNFLNTAKYESNIDTPNLISHTTILPQFPLITLNIAYTFNNFKQHARGREGSDFFEGINY